MPIQVNLALIVQAILMVSTTVMLLRRSASRSRKLGIIFLCVTFCWSVILGCIIALNGMTVRI